MGDETRQDRELASESPVVPIEKLSIRFEFTAAPTLVSVTVRMHDATVAPVVEQTIHFSRSLGRGALREMIWNATAAIRSKLVALRRRPDPATLGGWNVHALAAELLRTLSVGRRAERPKGGDPVAFSVPLHGKERE